LRLLGFVRRKIKRSGAGQGESLDFVTVQGREPHSSRKGALPMELPSTVTAVMAIVSFSFLAAIILGMV
jgi:hypothetical protein